MKFISLFLFVLLAFKAFGQTKFDTLIKRIEVLPDNIEKVETYLELSREYESVDVQLAFSYVDKMEALSKRIKYKKGVRSAIREKGILYYNQREFGSAILKYKSAFTKKIVTEPADSADLFNLLGVAYQDKGQIDSALLYLNNSLDIYERIDSDKGRITIFSNMGNCFYQVGDEKQALVYAEKAYELTNKGANEELLFKTAINYAMLLHLVEKDVEKVDSLISVVMKSSYAKANPDMLSAGYQNLATFYYSIGELNEAEKRYQKALEVASASSFESAPGIHMGLGQIYLEKERYTDARDQFKKGLNKSTSRKDLLMSYENLAKVYTVINQADSATHYWNKHIELLRAIEEDRIQDLLLKSKTNTDIVIKDGQIKLLNEQAKVDALNAVVKRNTIIALVIVVILLSVIIVLFSRKKKKELALNEAELKLKNQKLVSLSLQINQKNQTLHDFEKSLEENQDSVDDPILLNSIKRSLKKSLQIDEDWKNFEIFFNDLHEGFYDKLKEDYPELSSSELKICSLSKLRFSLKEIAQTLFLSVDSVKSARYRIRKKLNISTEVDLADFLNSL